MAYKSLLVTLLCLHLRDAAAFGSFPAQHPAPPPAPPSAPPVGCMEASTAVNAACDLSTANTNLTSFCSGDCHDALMSTSISCDANDASEAQNKTEADQYLSYCSASGCGRLASEHVAACDLGGVSPSSDESRYCSGDCNAALTATSAGCDANDAAEAEVKTGADGYLSLCSACAVSWRAALTACFFVNSLPTAQTDPCSGECNAALTSHSVTSASTGCDVQDLSEAEASYKTQADSFLRNC